MTANRGTFSVMPRGSVNDWVSGTNGDRVDDEVEAYRAAAERSVAPGSVPMGS
jgi:hypothetical protein